LLNALEQNVSKTLISLARLCRVKYGRFWLLSGIREIGAEIRELPENTGDLATLHIANCRTIVVTDDVRVLRYICWSTTRLSLRIRPIRLFVYNQNSVKTQQ